MFRSICLFKLVSISVIMSSLGCCALFLHLYKRLNSSFWAYAINNKILSLKAPITTATDGKFCNIFPDFRQKYGMIFNENRPADDSHEISCLI